MPKSIVVFLFVFLLSGFPVLSFAQPYDSGSILNQQQTAPSVPERLPRQEKEQKKAAPSETGVRVLVKGFRFTGIDGVVSEAELMNLVRDAEGKALGFSDLIQLAAKVTAYLRKEKGYLLARAYLPKQDVTEGIVEIAVIAGRMEGNARVHVAGKSRIHKNVLDGIAQEAIPPGGALRLARIERAVLLMDDLPGISAKASVARGDKAGTSRLDINVQEEKLVGVSIDADNFGDRYTGIFRTGVQLALNDPFGLGDGVSFGVLKAENLAQGGINYSFPLGYSGLTGSLHYSLLGYSLGKELSDLDEKGSAQTVGAALTYPILRTRRASLWTNLTLDRLDLKDEMLGETTGNRNLLVGKGGVSARFYDGFGGGGLTVATLAVYYGNVDLSAVDSVEAYDAAGPGTAGNFLRATYFMGRLQHLWQRTTLFLSARGQFSDGNLDSSQKFILGGPAGVRAYPVGEGAGDEGHMISAEIRYDLPVHDIPFTVQMVGFVDTGMVRLHHDPWPGSITNATGENTYRLSGSGVGINLDKPGAYGLHLSYAVAIGDNDGRNPDGTNVDNENDDSRFWVQGIIWF